MQRYDIICPCHFGLEAVLKREIQDLGYDIARTEDGRVIFHGDADAVVRANIYLRTAERVLIDCAEFEALTFDELFEAVKAVRWEDFIPKDGRFWVKKASSVNSKLFSPRDIQSIVKKAMVDHLSGVYGIKHFEETGEDYPLRVFINKNHVTLGLDTTGDSLHKRGYRPEAGEAPIAENLAAALIMLTPWKADRYLLDPFCGSGTFAIEAAMIARHIPPGLTRRFTAERWTNLIEKKLWYEVADEAGSEILPEVKCDIQGYDIDPRVLSYARENAKRAGVADTIHFQERAVADMSHHGKYGFIITNPPYGERIETLKTLPKIYRELGEGAKRLDTWSMYVITSYDEAEKHIGKKAAKNRKIYNGMIQTRFLSFPGPKPPGRRPGERTE
ncbi:MAG: class I SAM-dependent RNA methyltransferase [Lachnospiraceae bacterium]|nr:class I SAM-dependent RNA methyltransferase [Lachnospiraceae bacterium]